MNNHAAAFRECLEKLDIAGMRKLWQHVSPHLPQPNRDEEILVTLHMARTQANSIALKMRAYSHAWLIERGYPSSLPDHMKPAATRLYPIVAKAVGISVNFKQPLLKQAGLEIRGAMENAVLEAYADGKQDDDSFIKARMAEARNKTMTKLLGRIAGPN